MNREVMDRWCEKGILALVLGILVLGPLALGAVRELEFATIQGLTAGVMLLWGARLWLNQRVQLLWPPVCWAVLAFAVYALARYLTADIQYVARLEVLHILVYTFLFFAILNNLHRQETTQLISLTLVFLAMAISFYAVYQFLSGSNHVWAFVSPYKHRGLGTYICPNHLGGFLEMLLPLALACTLTGRSKPITRVFLGYAALAILAGIVVSMSRGTGFRRRWCCRCFLGCCCFIIITGGRRWRCWWRWLARALSFSLEAFSSSSGRRNWSRRRARSTTTCALRSGRRPGACGKTIPGGASGRATSITASASTGPNRCRPGRTGSTTITSTCWPITAWRARRWWPQPGCGWVWAWPEPGAACAVRAMCWGARTAATGSLLSWARPSGWPPSWRIRSLILTCTFPPMPSSQPP